MRHDLAIGQAPDLGGPRTRLQRAAAGGAGTAALAWRGKTVGAGSRPLSDPCRESCVVSQLAPSYLSLTLPTAPAVRTTGWQSASRWQTNNHFACHLHERRLG